MKSEDAEAKPPAGLYPMDVAGKLLDAIEPVNQVYQVMVSLLNLVPNLHAPFHRLVDSTDAEKFREHSEDIKRYSQAAYGSLCQLVDIMCKNTDKLKPSALIPTLRVQ